MKLIQFIQNFLILLKSHNRWWGKIGRALFSSIMSNDIVWRLFMLQRKIPRINNRKKPVVSVAIPVYKSSQYLTESLDSIIKQTFQDFELILVCDGSPREVSEIVRICAQKNKKIRAYYLIKNDVDINPVRAWNKAIREARGSYLAFQNGADIAEPDRLENSVYAIEKHDVDVVYGRRRILREMATDTELANRREFFSSGSVDEPLMKGLFYQGTVMVRTEALLDVGGFKEKLNIHAEHELLLRLAHFGYQFKSVQKVLTNSRFQSKDNSKYPNEDDDIERIQLLLKECTKKNVMKPKIAYVVPGTGISGGVAVVCEHVNRLILRGYDVSIVSEDNIDRISWFPNQLAPVIPLKAIADETFDIIVATGWTTAYTVQQIKAKRRFYFVQSDESRFYPSTDFRAKKAKKTYDMEFEFITMARWLKTWLKKEFGKDSTHVPNGLNKKIIYPDRPLEEKANRVRVLLEGPIDVPFKGMEDAFRAVNGLDCDVWCVSSLGKPKLEWRCDRFFEQVPLDQMRKIYSSCDILLKMSRVESFCYPPLEMMACGGTAVVGEVTGIDEYIVDGYNALVVEQGDIQGAHNALEKLIDNGELRNELIANGKKTADTFQWESSIDLLEDLFF